MKQKTLIYQARINFRNESKRRRNQSHLIKMNSIVGNTIFNPDTPDETIEVYEREKSMVILGKKLAPDGKPNPLLFTESIESLRDMAKKLKPTIGFQQIEITNMDKSHINKLKAILLESLKK